MLHLRVAKMFYNRNQCWSCAQVALLSHGAELHTPFSQAVTSLFDLDNKDELKVGAI